MHGHPPLGEAVHRVHALLAVEVQQGVACVVVLHEERHHRPLAGLHRMPHQRGAVGVVVGTSQEGKEEDERYS